jgi:hypothetical protein
MLSSIVAMPANSTAKTSDRTNFLGFVQQKALLYGNAVRFHASIKDKSFLKTAFLSHLEKRYGRLSPVRGYSDGLIIMKCTKKIVS